tara:strand:+ start:83 stop:199 length:117 start_codon:yes stop_codon:yes gene_type:complete
MGFMKGTYSKVNAIFFSVSWENRGPELIVRRMTHRKMK